MQPRIEGKRLLRLHVVSSGCGRCDEYQVPTLRRNSAWNENEFVCAQKLIAIGLPPRHREFPA
jgi:hypothetical protein